MPIKVKFIKKAGCFICVALITLMVGSEPTLANTNISINVTKVSDESKDNVSIDELIVRITNLKRRIEEAERTIDTNYSHLRDQYLNVIEVSLKDEILMDYNNLSKDELLEQIETQEKYLSSLNLAIHFMHESGKVEYLNRLADVEKDNLDNEFVLLCKEGKLIIKDNEKEEVYPLIEFYIVYSKDDNGNNRFFLTHIHDSNNDFVTREDYDVYKKVRIAKFVYTTIFLNMYNDKVFDISNNNVVIKKEDLKKLSEYINSWNGMLHDSIPETAALLPAQRIIVEGDSGYAR